MRGSIIVAGNTFYTKVAIRAHAQEILYRSSLNDAIMGDDHKFLHGLLERHPDSDQKIGGGVAFFFVGVPPNYPGQRGFWLCRVDGTKTDWSFLECISPTKHRAKVLSALRAVIAHQVIEFKANEAKKHGASLVCSVSGKAIDVNDCHVDHESPNTFLELVNKFFAMNHLSFDDVKINAITDGQTIDHLSDSALAAKWSQYHREHAQLRLVSKWTNLSTLKTRRQPT